MMPDNQHSHSNVVVSIPADLYLRDKEDSKFCVQANCLLKLFSAAFLMEEQLFCF